VSESEWQRKVRRAVSSIPKGQTASYAQVALLAGRPGAARAVVRALTEDMAWWRVVKADGTVAKEMLPRQSVKLLAEGVRLEQRRVPRASRWTPFGSAARGTTSPEATPSPGTPSGRSRSAPPSSRRARAASGGSARRPR
jgi:alkylated DNA nucleotide flippase Atl1